MNEALGLGNQTHWFATTHWSVVVTAAEASSPAANVALETLCRAYWYPLYAHVRRRGHDSHTAQDLTQAFFERVLEKHILRSADPTRGKFRSFLLACLGHFLANEWRDRQTLKRGGSFDFVPLDLNAVEERFATAGAPGLSPELAYDREWALSVLQQAMSGMECESADSGRLELFHALKPFLIEPTPHGSYESMAARFSMTPHAIGTAVMRLRQRFREVVREIVAQTVTTPLELEEELRHLGNILGQ